MITFFSVTAALLICLAFATHLLGLPANWIILALLWGWDVFNPEVSVPLPTYVMFAVACLVGEGVEFGLQAAGAKKYGASRSGNWGAIAGAIFGAIFGAPFFFGLGALIGAVGGAYAGCLGAELLRKRPLHEARQAAWGAMVGKALGLAVKIGIGIILLFKSFGILFG